MYKRLGLSDTQCAAYSGWLSLPWVIKPLWSPIVEIFKTKRWWILTMQALMGIALALIAFTIPKQVLRSFSSLPSLVQHMTLLPTVSI